MQVFQGALCALSWVNQGLNLQLYRPLEPKQLWLSAGAHTLMKFWYQSAIHWNPLPALGSQLHPFPGAVTHEPGQSPNPGMARQIQSHDFAFSGYLRLDSNTATTTGLPF